MVSRGIITHRNEDVDKLNEKIIQRFPRESRVYHSFDKVENDTQNLYQQEFLNSISPGGMPPHALHLKVGAPIMLLRNLDPSSGILEKIKLLQLWENYQEEANMVADKKVKNQVSIKVDKKQLGKLIVRELLRQQQHRNPIISDRASICSKDNMNIYVAIEHAHSFSVQSFENRKELADKKREMKTLEDLAEVAIKAQNDAEEKAESVEAISKVLET
ncbi:uncharacterized protein LOC114268266 [Camellia sinensis]|uniref:uncharacterized protein LOC114268266 n=1 Tax=Camellia sinensis TaxID=4442 RepID=UPI001036EC4F|nr:uncharacterized protein LOC114268266 [Camellia sinensis]